MTRVARLITHALAPAVVIAVVCLAVAYHATGTITGTIGWGMGAALGTSILPMGIIMWGVRRGRLSDVHVRHRTQRLVPLAIAIGTSAAGVGCLIALTAPRPVTAIAVALLSGVVTTTAITVRWKISFHAAVASGVVGVFVALYGPIAALGALVVAAIAWSRVRLGDHTFAQVVVGALWGLPVMSLVYWGLV